MILARSSKEQRASEKGSCGRHGPLPGNSYREPRCSPTPASLVAAARSAAADPRDAKTYKASGRGNKSNARTARNSNATCDGRGGRCAEDYSGA